MSKLNLRLLRTTKAPNVNSRKIREGGGRDGAREDLAGVAVGKKRKGAGIVSKGGPGRLLAELSSDVGGGGGAGGWGGMPAACTSRSRARGSSGRQWAPRNSPEMLSLDRCARTPEPPAYHNTSWWLKKCSFSVPNAELTVRFFLSATVLRLWWGFLNLPRFELFRVYGGPMLHWRDEAHYPRPDNPRPISRSGKLFQQENKIFSFSFTFFFDSGTKGAQITAQSKFADLTVVAQAGSSESGPDN